MVDYMLTSLYIVAFVLGAMLANLNYITYINKKTIENKVFLILSVFILAYLIVEFYIINQAGRNNSEILLRVLITISNSCYYFYVYYWLMLLAELSSHKFDKKRYIAVFVAYGVSMESIGMVKGGFKSGDMTYFMEPGIFQTVMIITNICFASWVIFLAAEYIKTGIKFMSSSNNKKGLITFGLLLILFEAWVLYWDFNVVQGGSLNPKVNFYVDPMVIISILYSVSVIWIFYKKDPLGICNVKIRDAKMNSLSNDITKEIVEKFGLTEREVEVMEAAFKGLSNPDIGKVLFISENTVKRHFNNIFRKTGTKNRYEIISLIINQRK